MEITRWSIEGYKSIQSVDIEPSDLNIFIGRNNSGKSNLIDSFTDYISIFDQRRDDLETGEWFERRVMGKDTENVITFDVGFELSEDEHSDLIDNLVDYHDVPNEIADEWREYGYFRSIDHQFTISENGFNSDTLSVNFEEEMIDVSEALDPQHARVLVLSELPERDYERTSLRYHAPQGIRYVINTALDSWANIDPFRESEHRQRAEQVTELDEVGENLAQVLHTLRNNHPEEWTRIDEAYTEIMEGVRRLHTPMYGVETTVEVDEEGFAENFELSEISSGSQEILILITKIVLAEGNADLLLIEEPELHLHPGAQKKIFELIQDVSETSPQVFVSTHSEVMVNQSDVGDLFRVERDRYTDLRTIHRDELGDELIDLGYDKSGLLQSNAVVFVEGKSDELILKQFAKTCDFDLDKLGVEIVELDGEGNIKSDGQSLVKLLFSFNIPYLFVADSHGDEPREVRDDYLESINSGRGDWHTTPDHFYIWSGYSIESYLVRAPGAIADVLNSDRGRIEDIIEEHSDVVDKAEVLEEIYDRELGRSYTKDNDGMLIAKQMNQDQVPREVEELLDNIADLVSSE
ncbi:MAG: ATP-dependent endonuclease [Halobacteriaceae archaeon]